MSELSSKEAYSKATVLCSKNEKCISDIRKKLFDWHVEVDDHDNVIDALIDNKYIDEERFATYFVRDKYRFNQWGKVKIKHHLFQKGISSEHVEIGLSEIDETDYLSILDRALQSKDRSIKDEDNFVRRQKLMRFAAGRGFSIDEINAAIDRLNAGQ